ncbi:hypothetical protein [Flavihumibacter sp. CACIAM 22H1]|uniref:hypothetical protein n=1 Tax=Flavihumibacter sp. CACIAM 22H1 TaxID=1812911 RepID=UPI0025C55700|nr:hypothetical protein [Flavihumibacter sp. CACIAM 22H1]
MRHLLLSTRVYGLLLGSSFLLLSCQKSSTEDLMLTDKPAVVQTWRFPCGPACDAAAWVLVMDNGNAYEAANLPADFQRDEQPVLVQFEKTGHKNALQPGTGLEMVSILKIRPR